MLRPVSLARISLSLQVFRDGCMFLIAHGLSRALCIVLLVLEREGSLVCAVSFEFD